MNGIRFRAELEKLINEQIQAVVMDMTGGAIKNMRDYKFRAGRLYSLQDVLSLMDDASKKVNGD